MAPPRPAAITPAAASRSAASSARPATDTIAESPAGSPSPARSRFAMRRSCAWIVSAPSSPSSASAGAAPTQLSHAGERSKRRASAASRSGAP